MKIYVASHKYLPISCVSRSLYQPLYVGACSLPRQQRPEGWKYDDCAKDNISGKNKTYCELTGLYWIWKHATDTIVGLAHYRRFLGKRMSGTLGTPLDEQDINNALSTHDALVARKENLITGFQDISSAHHYRLCHCSLDLQHVRYVIGKCTPDYLEAFDWAMRQPYFYPCNMIICKKSLLDQYASWLFSILEKLEDRIDPLAHRNAYQQRVFGFIAERLLAVFLKRHNIKILEYPLLDDELSLIAPDLAKGQPAIRKDLITEKACCFSGHNYSRIFDPLFYLRHYGEVAEYYKDSPDDCIKHFFAIGIHEGHMAHPCFCVTSYINGNPQLRNRFDDKPMEYIYHYLRHPITARHAIGYENMRVLEKDSEASVHRNIRTNFMEWHMERKGVID